MDFERVSIQNFLTIGKAEVSLAKRGLLLLQGQNLDDTSAKSNGAGKSSVPDAICWCLYGTTARGEGGDAIVNRVAKKNCLVSVSLSDAGARYRIDRYRKDATHKNQLFAYSVDSMTGALTDLSKGTDKETQEVVNRIMGCSLDVFCGAIYAGQEKMPNLPGMTDKELKLLIEEAAGVSELSDCYSHARISANLTESKLQVHRARLSDAIDQKTAEVVRLKEAQDAFDEFETSRKTRARTQMAGVPTYTADIAKHEADLLPADGAAELAKTTALQDAMAGRKSEEVQQAKLQAEVSRLEREQTLAIAALRAAVQKRADAMAAIEEVDTLVGKPCGECGKAYCAHDLEDAKKARQEALKATDAQAESVKANAVAARTALGTAQAALDTFKAGMTDASEAARELAAVFAALNQHEKLKSTIESLQGFVAAAKKLAQEKLMESNPHKIAVERSEALIKTLDAKVTVMTHESAALEQEFETYSDAVKVFGPAGVRAHILDTVTPFLNDRTSEYLGALADGNITATWNTLAKTAKGELREKFNIEVNNIHGGSSFGLQSGGEKRKVRLATAMALQDMVATRAAKPINLFVADEIDDALDVPALERLMTVLDTKSKERGTVLVISHHDLKDWIDNVITVSKSGGMSSVSGAMGP